MRRAVLTICMAVAAVAQPARAQQQPARADAGDQPKPAAQSKARPAAQQPDKAVTDQARRQLFALVVAVLRSTADEAKGWKDASAAASVQAQAADLLWDVDADAGRDYLQRAWDSTSRVEEAGGERSRFRNVSARTNARQEVMLVARKRAPALAKRWLEQMAQDVESDRKDQPRGIFDDRTARSTVLLEMAMRNAADNPKAAADLATESLQDGISFGLQNVLVAIQGKDPALAQAVFRAALARLRTAGLGDPNELLILYAYLYTPGRVPGANTTGNRNSFTLATSRNQPQITAAAQLNPALALEFLRLAADLLVAAPLPSTTSSPEDTARAQISVIGFLIGKLSQIAPDQAAMLQARMGQIETDAHFSTTPSAPPPDIPTPKAGEPKEEYAQRRVDSLEEVAEKQPDQLSRDIAYAKAALATAVERYERGWNLADKIEDKTLSTNVKNWLTYRAALHFVGAGDFDKAHGLMTKNDDPAQRAASLVVGAQKLAKKDKFRATQWLQEAGAIVGKADPDENWRSIAFGIVSTYARFDSSAALQALSEAVSLANKVQGPPADEEKAPTVRRFSGLTLSDFTYGTTGFGLKAAVGALDADQFEAVLPELQRLTQPEARGTAILALCRKYLQSGKDIHVRGPKQVPEKDAARKM